MSRYCILTGLVWLASSASASGQTVVDTTAVPGYVRVAAPVAGAALYADGERLGSADGVYAVAATATTFTLVEEGGGAWNARQTAVTLDAPPASGDTTVLALSLPVRYQITTIPPGADVVLETPGGAQEALGTGPLVVDRPERLSGRFVATRPGYFEASAAPGDSGVNHVRLVLRPLTPEEGVAANWRAPRRSRAWIDYAAAGVALASAAVAVHYKFQADAVDDRYRLPDSAERGDPALRAEAERLDRNALFGLVGMQLGLGVLAIHLVLR